ncbi:CheR family methyltransferase [Paracoccus sp. SM22M-07]|uniref:CheR family methyltransferase n=1 Tax=Paracoccus sp. SM22M-07 TaxID=1520813 RepID=UPI0009316C6C|nr:CheR family methyltransferase [Paracoccus sp. SM22M-07]
MVIIHLAPDQPSSLSDILASVTAMGVHQVADSPKLKPDCVYVISPDRELVVEDDHVMARPFTDPRGKRAPIDMFFRSVAAVRGDGLAVILSGAGSDGALGIRDMKNAGAVVFVQEPADAEFAMMPYSAISSGAADFVAPIPRLVERIVEVVHSKDAVRSLSQDVSHHYLQRIVNLLRTRTGHDFSSYKRATVMRRVARRMQVTRSEGFQEYADYLSANPEEAQELFGDLLISVTSFFRDPGAYDILAREGLGSVFDNADEGGIRAWVAGCATGEEAYSLAILLLEEAQRRQVTLPIQIFATDLDEGALATAREARYPASIEAAVDPDRLSRFFIREGAHYRIRKEVRDLVLFASHSVVKDPPFLRLDLITCRNLMIYLERQLQREVCALFAYGLKPDGLLFLGSAETIDAIPDLFAPVHREARLYRARAKVARKIPLITQMPVEHRPQAVINPAIGRDRPRDRSIPSLHLDAIERAAAPSILVDRDFHALHLSAEAGRFLRPSGGPISTELTDMVRPELRLDLRTALRRAFDRGEATLTMPIPVDLDSGRCQVLVQVTPISDQDSEPARHALAAFLNAGPVDDLSEEGNENPSADEIIRLRGLLNAAEARLLASRAENETSIQDLRVANEELQSINEEYRSTSEELETSKEELQSINEELQTVNAELKSKLKDVGAAHNDLQNIVAATDIGTLFLDRKLRIRMFTPRVADLFNITSADVGRVISDFTHRLDYQGLAEDAAEVLRNLAAVEKEVRASGDRWLSLRVRPYRTIDDRIEGVVVTLIDISALREAHESIRNSAIRQRFLLDLSDRLRSLTDADEMKAEACRLVRAWLDVEHVHFWNADTKSLPPVLRDHPVASPQEDEAGPVEFNWALGAAVEGGHVAVRDTQNSSLVPKDKQQSLAEAGFGSFLGVPLTRDNRLVGLLCIGAEQGRDYHSGEIDLLRAVVDRLSAMLERSHAEAAQQRSEIRLRALIDATEDVHYRMSPDWSEMIELVSQGFLADTSVPDRTWQDRYILADDRPLVQQAIQQAVRTKSPFQMEHRVRLADGGIGWTQSRAVPILDKQGRILEWFGVARDTTEQRQAQHRLQEARDALALATRASQLGWGTWNFATGEAGWDARAREIIGLAEDEDTIAAWLARVRPEDQQRIKDEVTASLREERPFELVYGVIHPDGSQHFVQGTGDFLRDHASDQAHGTGLVRDVTERRRWEESQKWLIGELNHRVKNMLSIVQSTARQTQRTTDSVETFADAFDKRLGAIAGAHSILTRRNWSGAELGELTREALASFSDTAPGQVFVEGPPVDLCADVTISFAMALHELATNAVKYGALSVPEGRVDVRWQVRDGQHVIFEWHEHGGPAVTPPARRGFGSRLIKDGISMELRGEVTLEFPVEGLRCKVEFTNDRPNQAKVAEASGGRR